MFIDTRANQCSSDGGACSLCLVKGAYLECKFGDKNTFLKHCRYYKTDGGYCDSIAAQAANKPESYSS